MPVVAAVVPWRRGAVAAAAARCAAQATAASTTAARGAQHGERVTAVGLSWLRAWPATGASGGRPARATAEHEQRDAAHEPEGEDAAPQLVDVVEVEGLADGDAEPFAMTSANHSPRTAPIERETDRDAGGGEQVGERVGQPEAPEDLPTAGVDGAQQLVGGRVDRPQAGDGVEQERHEAHQRRDGEDRLQAGAEPDHERRGVGDDRRDLDEDGHRLHGPLEEASSRSSPCPPRGPGAARAAKPSRASRPVTQALRA